MEEPKTNQERNNKAMTIKITTGAGGGIGGIVFLGGALLAASLVSAFAFKRRTFRKTEQLPKSSPENDVTLHLTPPPEAVAPDLPNDLEVMMKSSKDHHSQIIKGLTFLLPADSFLPKNSSIDAAAAETGAARIESAQVLILDDEKAKFEVNGAGNQEMVLSEIQKESTPLFDGSNKTIITKEECSFSISEASSLELSNNMGSDQIIIRSDGLLPESNGFHNYGVKSQLSSPLVDTPLHSEPESTKEDEYFLTEKLPEFVEAVELLVEEGCEVKNSLPLLDSKLLSEFESTNKDELSKGNSPVSVEAVELLEEEEKCEGKSSLPLLDSPLVFRSESMNKDEFLTEAIPVFAEVVGLQIEDCQVKSSLPLLDIAEAESTNIGNFSIENPAVSDRDLELLEEDSEENNAGTGYEDEIVVEKELDVCDAIVLEMAQEDVVHEIAQVDQLTDDKETWENHDVEKVESEPLVEAIEVKEDGETSDVAFDSIDVREDKLEVLIGKELEEVKDVEENGNEIVGVDQIIAEVNEEVKLIGKGEKDDVFGETNLEECEKPSTETILDQVAEEERIEVSDDEETVSDSVPDELQSDEMEMCPLTEEGLDLSEVAIEVVSLDPVKAEDEAEMRLIEEETEECDDVIIEEESTETADADEVIESLEDGENEEFDEVDGDIIENESVEETADVDELYKNLENGEKDNSSSRMITEQELSEPMVDGSMVLDSGKVPPFIEAPDADETALVDQALVEDEYPRIQPMEEGTTIVKKTPPEESSEEEDSDDEEESEDNGEEESSEGTEEDLSTESNCDAVWPAESIQDLSFKLNQMKTNNNDVEVEVETINNYVKEVENKPFMEPLKVKSWAWAMLATLWFFCHSYLDLPCVKVSLVALLISIAVLFGFPNRVLAKHK